MLKSWAGWVGKKQYKHTWISLNGTEISKENKT